LDLYFLYRYDCGDRSEKPAEDAPRKSFQNCSSSKTSFPAQALAWPFGDSYLGSRSILYSNRRLEPLPKRNPIEIPAKIA
jgi:hypothetical protein